jgi:hypothetical protein
MERRACTGQKGSRVPLPGWGADDRTSGTSLGCSLSSVDSIWSELLTSLCAMRVTSSYARRFPWIRAVTSCLRRMRSAALPCRSQCLVGTAPFPGTSPTGPPASPGRRLELSLTSPCGFHPFVALLPSLGTLEAPCTHLTVATRPRHLTQLCPPALQTRKMTFRRPLQGCNPGSFFELKQPSLVLIPVVPFAENRYREPMLRTATAPMLCL